MTDRANIEDLLPHAYLVKKLALVMPVMQEARDALPAITEERRQLRGISRSLADRMDAAGTYGLSDWEREYGQVSVAEQIAARARDLVDAAARAGFVLTITQHSLQPWAMGRYETRVEVRQGRGK